MADQIWPVPDVRPDLGVVRPKSVADKPMLWTRRLAIFPRVPFFEKRPQTEQIGNGCLANFFIIMLIFIDIIMFNKEI